MKWLATVVVVALCAFAANVEAAPIKFTGTFSGLNENPVNASPGTGFVSVELDPVAHTLFLNATFSGLLGTTTAAHIHCCALPGVNAGVATQTPSFVGFPLGVTAGSFTNTLDLSLASSWNAPFITNNGGTPATAEAVLLAGLLSGRAYFNIHTSFAGGGEVRANLEPVPEPATMVLVGLGLATAVFARRQSARRRPE